MRRAIAGATLVVDFLTEMVVHAVPAGVVIMVVTSRW